MRFGLTHRFAVSSDEAMIDETLLQEASNPTTPSNRLSELLKFGKEIARVAMRNPNLPRESLFSSAHQYPREFIENPALPLLLLEKSDPTALKAKTIKAIAQQHDIERDILEALLSICSDEIQVQLATSKVPAHILRFLSRAGSAKVRQAIAENRACDAELLRSLAQDKGLQLAVAKNSATPTSLLESLSLLHEELQAGVAQNPQAPASILERLAASPSISVRQAVARNLSAPAHCLAELAKDVAQSVLEAVAKNAATPVRTLELLSKDERQPIRRAVTENPNAPAALLVRLASDKANWVVEGVFRHPNTPHQVLRSVLRPGLDPSIHIAASGNPSTPPDLLAHLSQSSIETILVNVASHPKTPLHVLDALYHQASYRVQGAIPQEQRDRLRLLEPSRLFPGRIEEERLTEPLLAFFAEDSAVEVRVLAAKHPRSPPALLRMLSSDENYQVLQEVAQNPGTPLDVLERFFRNKDTEERSIEALDGLVQNPNTPVSFLEEIADDPALYAQAQLASLPNITPRMMESLLRNGDYFALCELARHESLPIHHLRTLATNANNIIRNSVAEHPNTPDDVIDLLSRDPEVCATVAWRAKLPLYIAERFSQENNVVAMRALASNEGLALSTYEELAKQTDGSILRGLLCNQSVPNSLKQGIPLTREVKEALAMGRVTPPQYLALLLQEENPRVWSSLACQANLSTESVQKILSRREPESLLRLAQCDTSEMSAIVLASSPERDIQRALLYRDALPVEALLRLAKSEEVSVRVSVARRKEMTKEVAMQLITDTAEVRRALAASLHTPSEILSMFAGDADLSVRCHLAANANTDVETLSWLVTDPELFVQRLVSEHPNTSAASLALMMAHPSVYVLLGVCKNPNTPEDALLPHINRPELQESLKQRARTQRLLELLSGL